MARTYPEKKEAAMSHISHHAAAGENPASRKPLVEETTGRKIVKGLFCAGVALSAVLCAPCASAEDRVVPADTKSQTVKSKVEGNVQAGGYSADELVSGNTITIVFGAEITTYTDTSGKNMVAMCTVASVETETSLTTT